MEDGNWTSGGAAAEEGPVAPPWAVWGFAGPVCGLGAMLAAWLGAAACRHGRCSRGRAQLMLLAHLALADAVDLLAVAPAELFVLAARGAWPLSEAWCTAFVGCEALVGAAAAYLVVCVCLHALLSPTSAADNSAGALPAAAAWLLAASLAAPLACQARAVAPRPGLLACSLHPPQELAQLLVGVVRVALPALLLLACGLAAAVRLCSLRQRRQGAGGEGEREEEQGDGAAAAARLRLALALAAAQMALGLARPALAAARALLASPHPLAPAAAFSAPPLAAGPQPLATLAVAMLHHTLPALRPLLCLAASRHVRDALSCGCRAKSRRVCRPLQS